MQRLLITRFNSQAGGNAPAIFPKAAPGRRLSKLTQCRWNAQTPERLHFPVIHYPATRITKTCTREIPPHCNQRRTPSSVKTVLSKPDMSRFKGRVHGLCHELDMTADCNNTRTCSLQCRSANLWMCHDQQTVSHSNMGATAFIESLSTMYMCACNCAHSHMRLSGVSPDATGRLDIRVGCCFQNSREECV